MMHCEESGCFEPSYKSLGLKDFGQAVKHIADYLFKHKNHIINLGFSEEVPFTMGNSGFILQGKNVGRKKDK